MFPEIGAHGAAACYFRDAFLSALSFQDWARPIVGFGSIISIMRIDAAVSPERHALPVRLALEESAGSIFGQFAACPRTAERCSASVAAKVQKRGGFRGHGARE
ncbi:hypothetical protein [Methylocystis sp. Sn-Cys]|uniref:hypothetical protein n=1 Tax=Methylocystis sp. Sn-Cys TaxID=1701263 RepID=UPI001924EAE2|nr:hypothetical protein [Methylocystis sp. Sn-Cys]MBL1256332.1 hypothetical protein [Methylocystis sp. Sn-Cys]